MAMVAALLRTRASPFSPANDAPVVTSDGGGATATKSLAENTKAVTTVTATDPDSSNLTYSIVGGADGSLFTIDAATGALAFLTAPDYEHPTDSDGNRVFDVIVQVSDGSLTDTQAIAVTVTNATPNETVIGDGDPNTFRASADKEAFSGQGGSDTVSYDTANAAVTANLASPNKNKGDASGDTYSSIENLRGSNFGDNLTGDNNDNVLEGGSGADQLNGGKGVNTASYEHAGTGVTANLSKAANNTGEALGDKFTSIQNLQGSAFDDKLTGDGGANALIGGSGADTLTGAGGKDMLTGGLGNDTFVFTTLQDSSVAAPDLITDFEVGDMLDFSAIDANTGPGAGGNQAFHIGGGGGHAGDVLATYDSATDITTVNLYVNNDATVDGTLLLTGDHHDLNSWDLIA